MTIIIALLVLILLAIIAPQFVKALFALPIAVGLITFVLNGLVAKPLYVALWITTGLFIAGGIVEVGKQIKNMGSED